MKLKLSFALLCLSFSSAFADEPIYDDGSLDTPVYNEPSNGGGQYEPVDGNNSSNDSPIYDDGRGSGRSGSFDGGGYSGGGSGDSSPIFGG